MSDFLQDPDVILMLDLKNGNELAFNALVGRHLARVVNFIYKLIGSHSHAEDVAQEVFLKIYRFAPRYEPKSKFTTWLYRIAVNSSHDFRRHSSSDLLSSAASIQDERSAQTQRIQIEVKSDTTPQKVLEDNQAQERIRTALLALPKNQRAAITLKIFEDKSYIEITEILECSLASVESLIFRARQNLKKILKDK